MKVVFFLLFTVLSLNAVSIKEIEKMPTSRAKDFYIYELLQDGNISKDKALNLFYQYSRINRKHFLSYSKYSDDKAFKEVEYCYKNRSLAKNTLPLCVNMNISPYSFSVLSTDQKKVVKSILNEQNISYEYLDFLLENDLKNAIYKYDPKTFVKIYNGAGKAFREKNFNFLLSVDYINKLSQTPSFDQFVKLSVTNPKMEMIQLSLLDVDADNLSHKAHFFLALNHLHYHDKKSAIIHLDYSLKKAYYQSKIDKVNWWKYLITSSKENLKALNKSDDINIYTLLADEITGKEHTNYTSDIYTKDYISQTNISDPFVWKDVLDKSKEMSSKEKFDYLENFDSKNELIYKSYILQKAYNGKFHTYIQPYKKELDDLHVYDQELYNAIMRQESRFMPPAISYSYALGLMQLMPFLIRHIDKSQKEHIKHLDELFKPEKNLKFAQIHMKHLKQRFFHPLLIAYAYNGGGGFTRRLLKSGHFKQDSYEPYYSMEMMVNTQSREYGKKVLANYIMYKKINHKKVSVLNLMQRLLEPELLYKH